MRSNEDHEMVDFRKGINNMKSLPYAEDTHNFSMQFKGDPRFWFPHQADWYSSVIVTKDNATTNMKYIDWDHLKAIQLPIIDEVIEACKVHNLLSIMSSSCD